MTENLKKKYVNGVYYADRVALTLLFFWKATIGIYYFLGGLGCRYALSGRAHNNAGEGQWSIIDMLSC